ncbi:MAG: bifunctional (p)ppGpp synthetase/guanosine-3',5'-bis(diphosphate) 3'-pyrophosphohydrolase, partial [Smithellaceae bacterium]|nr:bifunctional (p)ppGpp synthetase/guanosine-3',5'-bis(diphosphate) 3'-pyrophosphohydrolase [Smithellaceae bacterium]
RILLVRLADRAHNMRTLGFQRKEKQLFIARETLELYAPLANRLGIHWMKTELEDLSFSHLYPEAYQELKGRLDKSKEQREQYTQEVKTIISQEMERFGLKGVVEGRAKHLYSIYRKMSDRQINFDEVYDLIAFRLILYSDQDKTCYEALSMIHALWKPVHGYFDDYIAMPKGNNYRSLHTTVIGPHGERVEIQIRTLGMHEWAEEGIAAHWRYKEGRAYKKEDDEQISRLRELLEVQQELANPREFMSNLKLALFPDEVYVFTPRGDVRAFPKGATPIDFAYSIHTDIGNQCIGAKVNRAIVPLKYQLKNGDTVEVITQPGHNPSKDWLKLVVTSRAISKIRNWVKEEELKRSITLGRDLFDKELKKNQLKLAQVAKSDELKNIFAEHSVDNLEDLMALVGYGRLSARRIVNMLMPEERPPPDLIVTKPSTRKRSSSLGISLTGVEDVMIRLAKCCNPIPGENIFGYISRGRGVTVHTEDCPSLKGLDPERLVDVHWDLREKGAYPVHLRVIATDKPGVLAEVTSAIASIEINISHATVNTGVDMRAVFDFILDVDDLEQQHKVVSAIKRIPGVTSVERIRKGQGASSEA